MKHTSTKALSPRHTLLLAAGLFLLALVPRVVGLGGFLTIDEIKWIEGAGQFTLALQTGDLAQTYWHFHPGITITWGETLLLWLGWLFNGGGLADYVTSLVADPAHTIGFFRLSGALLTALFAPGVYLLGRRIFGAWTAGLAGALIALNPFLLAHSRIVNGDAGAAGLMFLSLLVFLGLWQGAGLQLAALSGVLGGLALLTKLPSPLIVPFTGLLALVGWWRDRRTWFWLCTIVVWGMAALVIFVLLWPSMWVDPLGTLLRMYVDTFDVGEVGEGHAAFFLGRIVENPGWGFYPYVAAFRLTPIVVLGLVLLVVVWIRHGREEEFAGYRLPALALIVYVVFVYVFSSVSPKKLDRYVMAVFPALDLLAALGFVQVLRLWMDGRAHYHRIVVTCLIVLVLIVTSILPFYPYYLDYYNPLMGGIQQAVRRVPVGWGETLEKTAAWLNSLPDAGELQVSAWYSDIFFPFFEGKRASFSSSGKSQLAADYVVFYVNQVQRQKPYPALVRYFQDRGAVYTVNLHGVPWAWVYRAPAMRVSTSDETTIEGRAELLGLDAPLEPVVAGESVPVRLYLHTLGQMPENEAWQVFLIDSQGEVAASITRPPDNREPEVILEHDVVLPVPEDAQPGAYSLGVCLWDTVANREVARFSVPESDVSIEVQAP